MNQREWKHGAKYDGKYVWRNKAKAIQISLQYNQNPNATHIHHLRDTEEQRKYNDEHYELWGFNQDGTFEYGKYVIFVTKEEHTEIHRVSEETRRKIGNASKKNWENPAYRRRITESNIGKTMSDSAKRKCRISKLGEKNPMYGKHHTEESNIKRSKSLKKSMTQALKDHLRQTSSGSNNAMFGRFGENHPSYGHSMSDDGKLRLSEFRKNFLKYDHRTVDNVKKDAELYKIYKSNNGTLSWNEFRHSLPFLTDGGSIAFKNINDDRTT